MEIYEEDTQQLRIKFSRPVKHFFKYFQVRNYINTIQGHLRSLSLLPIDSIIREKKGSKGFVSYMYTNFIDLYGEDVSSSRLKWEKDLECTFKQDTWELICESALTFSFNSRHRLMQFNIIHRVYYTPERLHKISDLYSECCPRCKTEVGTLLHMFWTCSKLKIYWRNIIQTIDKMTNVKLPYDLRFILLGDESILQPDQRKNLRLVKMALIAAKKCIAIQRKSEEPPRPIVWLRELSSYVPVEKTKCLI